MFPGSRGSSSRQRADSRCWTARRCSRTWPGCRAIGWRRSEATGPGSTAFGSASNGGSVSAGMSTGPATSRWWTTTKRWENPMPARNGMRPVHPGEIRAGRAPDAGLVGQRAVEGARRAREPGHGDLERPTWRHRGHGPPAGALLRDDTDGLAELAADLRPAPSRDRRWPTNRRVRATSEHRGVAHSECVPR